MLSPPTPARYLDRHASRLVILGFAAVALLLLATQPALAQSEDSSSNPICQDNSETIANMVEGFIQITTALGLMGLLVVWQAETLMSIFSPGQDKKQLIKQHKRDAARSAGTLVVLGPLFAIAGSAMQLPIAQCIDLVPY